MKPSLGQFKGGGQVYVDVARLVETRLLIQAGSGFGKSYACRRLLEQTAGKVQQIVVDPDGEFASLREKHDYVIAAAQGGDAIAHPRSAALLARRLLETEVSAILDIYELKAHERSSFVRQFFDAMVNAPKSLWHPVLVLLDEAHVYCPEAGSNEASGAVIDMATRGRKRGFGLVVATQRLAKFHKDAAAELFNKLIGRCQLDVDVKRAAAELGMTPKDALEAFKTFEPGDFFVFGPALAPSIERMKVGDVQTTHPKAGQRGLRAPPAPTAAIKALLPKLADLPKEAEQELRTAEDLRKELANVRRELTQVRKATPPALQPKASAGELRAAQASVKRLKTALETLMKFVVQINAAGFAEKASADPEALRKAIDAAVAQAVKLIDQRLETRARSLQALERDGKRIVTSIQKLLAGEDVTIALEVKHTEPFTVKTPPPPRPRQQAAAANGSVSAPQQKLLDKLAWLEGHGLYPAPKETLAAVAGVSPTSGGYFNNLGALRSSGLIEYPTPGEVGFTDQGRGLANLSDDARPVHEHWLEVVTVPQRKILEALIARHPEAVEKDELAGEIGVSATSGGYFNNLGRLRTLGAIDYPQKGHVSLTRHVMP